MAGGSDGFRRIGARASRFVALALVVLCGSRAAAEVPPLGLRYDVFAAGFPILTLDFQLDEGVNAYRIVGWFHTNGVVGWLSGWAMHTESDGSVAADALMPSVHEADSRTRGRERRAHLDYRRDGSIAANVSPPEDPAKPSPSPQQIAGTVDPLTAILEMSHRVARDGRCATRVPVFDGRRRYDLAMADDGTDRLPPSPAYAVSGEMRRCTVAMVKIAGFSYAPDYGQHVDHGRVWLASPWPGALPLPVKLEFDSDWGWITIRMTAVTAAK